MVAVQTRDKVLKRFEYITKNHKAQKSPNFECVSMLVLYIENRVSDPHFFADPDPGKNLHADPDPDPDPDPGGIRGRGLGVKGKNDFFFSFFHVSDDS